jgi:hypothetical protein
MASFLMAGFQVTTNGRFWVTPEAPGGAAVSTNSLSTLYAASPRIAGLTSNGGWSVTNEYTVGLWKAKVLAPYLTPRFGAGPARCT